MYNRYYNEEIHQRRQWTFRAIKQCIDEGMETKQIAEELGISKSTVKRYARYIRESQEE